LCLARRSRAWAALFASIAALSACGDADGDGRSASVATPSATRASAAMQSVSLGGGAYSVAYGFGAAWVQVDPPVDGLVKVGEESGKVAPGVPRGRGVAITDDAIWVTVAGETLEKIDPHSGTVLLTAKAPGANYVSEGAGAVWIPTEGGVARVDPRTGAMKKISTESDITDLFATDDDVWATVKSDGLVFRIDPRKNTVVAVIPTGPGAHGIAVDDNGVWVTNYTANTVSRIDPKTNKVAATIEGVGSGVGIRACDGAIIVSTRYEGISRIDPETNQVTPLVPLNEWNYGIACGDGELWISSTNGHVYRLPLG
jgi:YVTN family beta-propeller protein